MLEMIRALYTLHQHIIDIYFRGVSDHILEDFANHSLKGSPAFLSPKGITL